MGCAYVSSLETTVAWVTMQVLLTGCAGFIGFHAAKTLLERGEKIVGIDNLNPYYDVNLKKARLGLLEAYPNFKFFKGDIADRAFLKDVCSKFPQTTHVLHLAAQAGVRYSLIDPYSYVHSNVMGHLTVLEAAKSLKYLNHFVYASSSSVYGANTKLPYSTDDPVEDPVSLYAATKRSCELISHCYSHLFDMPQTGLRFFTVYGPWGRPDMAAFLFTKGILSGEEISVYNNGDMRRNFTYIDDIVDGTIRCLDSLPKEKMLQPIYNIGNNRSEQLMDFIQTLESHLNMKAKIKFEPIQPGDVKDTVADIEATQQDLQFMPRTNINEGLEKFVAWYRDFYEV
jgi:UDP-glucuronate 4-epimerase